MSKAGWAKKVRKFKDSPDDDIDDVVPMDGGGLKRMAVIAALALGLVGLFLIPYLQNPQSDDPSVKQMRSLIEKHVDNATHGEKAKAPDSEIEKRNVPPPPVEPAKPNTPDEPIKGDNGYSAGNPNPRGDGNVVGVVRKLMDKGMADEAQSKLEKALAKDPNSYEVRQELIKFYMARNQANKARILCLQALELSSLTDEQRAIYQSLSRRLIF
jgi:tetratricopeptide (TPR) repeat protein